MLVLEHGKPMIFGKDRDKGIRLRGLIPEVVTIGENGVTEATSSSTTSRPRSPTSR
jgi:2-oxoglutarate ferredoxin oxidoreductase subunit beta